MASPSVRGAAARAVHPINCGHRLGEPWGSLGEEQGVPSTGEAPLAFRNPSWHGSPALGVPVAPVWGEDPRTRLSSSSSRRKPTFGSAERKTPVKKLVSEFSKVKSKTPKHSPGKEESGGSLSETVCKRELRSQETPEKPRSLLETPLRASAPPKGPGAHPKEKGFFSSETDDLPYLSTTEMYLCRWHQPPPSPLPLREPSPKKEETVASKRWRARRGAGGSVPGVGAEPAVGESALGALALKVAKGRVPLAVGAVQPGRAAPPAPPAARGVAALVPAMGSYRTTSAACPAPACWHRAGQGCRPRSALAAQFAEQPARARLSKGVKQLPVGGWETCHQLVPLLRRAGSLNLVSVLPVAPSRLVSSASRSAAGAGALGCAVADADAAGDAALDGRARWRGGSSARLLSERLRFAGAFGPGGMATSSPSWLCLPPDPPPVAQTRWRRRPAWFTPGVRGGRAALPKGGTSWGGAARWRGWGRSVG